MENKYMKTVKILPILLLLVMVVSACGAEAVPTMNAADVQSTAVAAAFTLVAQTQAAIPTATPLPPTNTATLTPLPTDTPVSLPTLNVTLTSTSAPVSSGGSGADPCANRVLSYSPKGRETVIRIANLTKSSVTVSVYLNETAGQGECGYRSYTLGKNDDVVISDLVQGCYNLWAWSTNNNDVNAGGSGCINNPDKWTFEIKESSIKFVGP
jgi:hypothetical protein